MLQMIAIRHILLGGNLLLQQKFCLGFGFFFFFFFVYIIHIILGQPQNRFFHNMLWKNLKKLFGHSNNILHVCAKLLQSCLTLCDLMDCSLPGSSVHGILQARTLEWVALSSSKQKLLNVLCPTWINKEVVNPLATERSKAGRIARMRDLRRKHKENKAFYGRYPSGRLGRSSTSTREPLSNCSAKKKKICINLQIHDQCMRVNDSPTAT